LTIGLCDKTGDQLAAGYCPCWLSISLPAHPRPTCGSRPARTRCRVCGGQRAGRPGVATVAATSAGPCTRPFRCESSRQLGVRPRRRRRLAPESSGARRLAVKWIANLPIIQRVGEARSAIGRLGTVVRRDCSTSAGPRPGRRRCTRRVGGQSRRGHGKSIPARVPALSYPHAVLVEDCLCLSTAT
jgi:hypothetical protein